MQSHSEDTGQIEALMHSGQYQQALALLDAQLHTTPDAAKLHWWRCQCLVPLQDLPAATQAADSVLRLRRNFVPALMLRIKLARDAAEDLDTEPLLRRVLKREPSRARAQYWLAELLLESDSDPVRQQEALHLLDQCIAASPMLLRARLLRADYHWNHYYEALQHERSDPAEAPQAPALPASGAASAAASTLELALLDYAWVSAHAHSHYAALRAAKALVRLERDAEALVYLEQLLAELPESQPLRHTVVQLHKRVTKRIAEASAAPAASGDVQAAD